MKVREVMTGDVRLVEPDRSIREAAQMMADQDIGALPVGENDRLVGMVTDRDIAIAGSGPGLDPDTKITEVMSQEGDVLLRRCRTWTMRRKTWATSRFAGFRS